MFCISAAWIFSKESVFLRSDGLGDGGGVNIGDQREVKNVLVRNVKEFKNPDQES